MIRTSDDDWLVPESGVMANTREALDADRPAVVATIAAVEGNAYRRPGAKMLIDDESGVGSITAGCLEDEVVDIAQNVLETGQPRLERFDLTDDAEWGLGLGCNGIIDLLLEPLDDRFRETLDRYADRRDGLALTVLDDAGDVAMGDRGYAPEGDLSAVESLPGWLVDGVRAPARDLYDREKSGVVTAERPDDDVDVFVDAVTAPPEMYVIGSGNDARPVSDLAAKANFRVTVVAVRGGRAETDAFPRAEQVVSASAPRIGDEFDLDEDSYAVLMTHNFVDDRLALESLLDTPVEYIGLMGPQERFDEMIKAFEAEGCELTDAELGRVYTPIGLDIGGGAPYQIAMGIVTEALAVHNDRTPQHLRQRKSPIHERATVSIEDG
ncbi:MAG: XdhC family protein [Halobacteriales archaeon]